MRKIFRFIFHRGVIVGTFIALQLLVLVLMIIKFQKYFMYFYAGCILLSMLVVLHLISNKSNPAYKIAWIIPIMLFPIFGGLFYLMFGDVYMGKRHHKQMEIVTEKTKEALMLPDQPVLEKMRAQSEDAGLQSSYLYNMAWCPPFEHTVSEFLPMGEIKFERMLQELEKAEHFIFLEYFIIQEGKMWGAILDVLKRKAAAGLDVRVMYDDMGCLFTLPTNYCKQLESMGIKCCVFNKFIPIMSFHFNNRDHRKICIIDGHTGFTGGINLADEYINAYPKHGHWKDCAILLRGDAVWSLTVMFLSIWDFVRKENDDFNLYHPDVYLKEKYPSDGFVQPFTDSPLDDEIVGETVYMNLINRAKRYVYINTPYLIVDNEMITALSNAAKCGVDVRILTPHIADKWYVHALTRAYYEALLEAGVKIYEYTPGFVHAKTFVVDDEYGVVGTINLDYRSLYLHFECGAWLYKSSTLLHLRDDYLTTLEQCQAITLESCRKVSWVRKLGRSVLRIFAPLM